MKKQTETPPTSADYNSMLELLGILSAAENRKAELQSSLNADVLARAESIRDDYVDTNTAITDATAAIEVIARQHPEWFANKKTLKTPFGSVQSRAGFALEIDSPEMTIVLLERAAEADPSLALAVRVEKSLNREMLEKLDDAELKRFRVRRVEVNNIVIKPATVDLGKAVSSAEQESAADQLPA